MDNLTSTLTTEPCLLTQKLDTQIAAELILDFQYSISQAIGSLVECDYWAHHINDYSFKSYKYVLETNALKMKLNQELHRFLTLGSVNNVFYFKNEMQKLAFLKDLMKVLCTAAQSIIDAQDFVKQTVDLELISLEKFENSRKALFSKNLEAYLIKLDLKLQLEAIAEKLDQPVAQDFALSLN